MTSTLRFLLLAIALMGFQPGAAIGSSEAEAAPSATPELEALAQLEQALDVARAWHGDGSVALVPALTELAQAYRLLGRADHAEPLYQQAIRLDDGGGDEARLAANLTSLALVYRAEGRLADAELLYERALPLLERTLGPEHPEVARCLTNRAVLYWHAGKPEKVLPLQQRALGIAKRAFGAEHPKTVALRSNLELMKTAPPAATAVAEPPQPLPAPPRPEPTAVPAPPQAEPPVAGRFLIEVGTVTPPAEAPTVWQRLVDRHASLAALEPRPPWRV